MIPLLFLQAMDDPLQLAALLPLHGLKDLHGALRLAAGRALASERLAVLKDECVLIVPVLKKKLKHTAIVNTHQTNHDK